jgi:hypothetical protein
MPSTKPHWLAPGGKSSSPGVVVSFDTETRVQVKDGREVLTLRCWDAIVRHRGAGPGETDTTMGWEGETPADLAQVLIAAAAVTGEAWCFAHNAGFDLTVTSLPMVLCEQDWKPEFVNIGEETCVFILTGPTGRLIITDSWSWLRCGLDTAAKDVGMRKTRLPGEDDDLAAWHHRCAHDTRILDLLISGLLDWWDSAQVGGFSVTGSGCGWRTMRARLPERQVLVGAEQPRTSLEREAIYGGRKEVWQVGRFTGHYVEDWDLRAAHLTVMATQLMPGSPVNAARYSPPPSAAAAPYGLGAVCRVEITTRVPCAPVRVLDDVWWPVGTFRTTVTTPELEAILELADRVVILEAQWYRMTDALKPWGEWCLDLQSQPDHAVPKVVKRVAKGWGRAVPGRFALRTSQLVREQEATHLGWALEAGHDLGTGDAMETVTFGGVARTYRKDQDGADCSPVVLAFVEGYVRAAMLRTVASRPAGQLLQCNTDGWWEERRGRDRDGAGLAVPAPFTAVRKAVTRDVTIYGPNHLDAKDDRRLAGIPKDARLQLNGSYAWQDWPGLRWQLQFSRPGEYLRPGREMLLADHYCRRWVLTSGETVPVTCSVSPAGLNVLAPWQATAGRHAGDVLADWQVPALHRLRGRPGDGDDAAGVPLPSQPGRRPPARP